VWKIRFERNQTLSSSGSSWRITCTSLCPRCWLDRPLASAFVGKASAPSKRGLARWFRKMSRPALLNPRGEYGKRNLPIPDREKFTRDSRIEIFDRRHVDSPSASDRFDPLALLQLSWGLPMVHPCRCYR
jgi:hypothetical protein